MRLIQMRNENGGMRMGVAVATANQQSPLPSPYSPDYSFIHSSLSLLISSFLFQRIHDFRCCSGSIPPNAKPKQTQTPQLLKIAVTAATEILRIFIPAAPRTDLVDDEWKDEDSVSNVDDVVSIIRSDYEKAYFVTGFFTSAIYAEECTFEDPTIKFQGKELYAQNLSLLLPFFESPSIQLKELDKDLDCETVSIVASWKLRTYIRLPWKPLICIDGTTTYDLDEEFRIVRHVERWSVSAFEAILQIFTPSSGSPDH